MSTSQCQRTMRPPETSDRRRRRLLPALVLPAADVLALVLLGVSARTSVGFEVVYGLGVLGLLAADGKHRQRLCLRTSDQVPRITMVATLPLVVLMPWWQPRSSVVFAAASVGLLVASRSLACAAVRAAHRRGFLMQRALVVGTGPVASQMVQLLDEHPDLGLVRCAMAGHQVPFMPRDATELVELVRSRAITRVLVCLPAAASENMVSMVRQCRSLPVDVCWVPSSQELGMAVARCDVDELRGITLIPLRRHSRRARALAKRVFDVLVGAVLAVAAAPALIVLMLAVRLSSGRALFRQLRVTGKGQAVEVVKLRTVIDGVHQRWAVRPEHCTRLGGWLRATHLDELPQLVHVLRGDLSLVGPRPERPYYALRFAEEVPGYADRQRIVGGVTGWAQVNGLHGDTSIPDRARYDNQYIEYWSPWLDAVIVIKTVAIVLGVIARSLVTSDGCWREERQ